MKTYGKKKVIVTGGAGFIGSHLSRRLIKEGYGVHIVDNLVCGKKENVPDGAVLHHVDICDYEDILQIFENAEYVFHLAALPNVEYSIYNPLLSNKSNVDGTVNVLAASQKAGIKKFIFASSCSVYGEGDGDKMREDTDLKPKSPYALQKCVCEQYARLWSDIYSLNTLSLRLFNVYGPGQRESGAYAFVIAIFLKLKSEKKPLTITGDGEQRRDFVHVRDVVDAFIKSMESETLPGDVINIGNGRNYSINEIARVIGGPVEYGEKRLEPRNTLCDNRKASKLLGWKPLVSLEEGIQELMN